MIHYIFLFSFILIVIFYFKNKYKNKLIFTLPVIVVFLEIGKTLSFYYGLQVGYNGFILLVILASILLSIRPNLFINAPKKIIMLFFIIAIFFITRLDFGDANILNLMTRLGNFLLVLFLFIVGYNRFKERNDLYLLNKSMILTTAMMTFSIHLFYS